MAAYTYNLPSDIVDDGGSVIIPLGNYRVQDNQITLIDKKEVHILVSRINLDNFFVDSMTFIVKSADLELMSNSITTGKAFNEELDILIWGWIFANKESLLLIGREALPADVMPVTTKVA